MYRRILETKYSSGFYLGLNSNGDKYQWIVNDISAGFGNVSGGTVSIGTRQYVFATYDGSVGKLYVDGNLVATGTFTAPGTTSFPLYIGKYYASNPAYTRSGAIDEVRIF